MPTNPDKIKTYICDSDGERVDVYLVRVAWYTRNFFHRVMARGDVLVNDQILKKRALRLKTGDIITVIHPERYMEAEILWLSPEIDLPIMHETPDYVVIHKRPGILAHPNAVRWVEHPSVVGALYHRYKQIPSMGNFIRAWLLHRLDKATDGMMIVAKTEAWLSYFKNLFQAKSLATTIEEKDTVPLKKFYRARCLLSDKWQQFLDSITLPHIIEELVKPNVPHYEPKMGITRIISSEYPSPTSDKASVGGGWGRIDLNIEILTGRTHQIRYHLSTHGLIIYGDYLYGHNDSVPMHLQAYRLQFTDLYGDHIDLSLDPRW